MRQGTGDCSDCWDFAHTAANFHMPVPVLELGCHCALAHGLDGSYDAIQRCPSKQETGVADTLEPHSRDARVCSTEGGHMGVCWPDPS